MEYVTMGGSGLKVSRISYGNMSASNMKKDPELDKILVKMAFDAGVNFFDTAQRYGFGLGEIYLGDSLRALGVPREDYVVSTKIFWGAHSETKNDQNVNGTNRKCILEGIEVSLKRLKMDYVDLLFCHRYDHTTPMEEVCWAMKIAIAQGKVLHWGTSEWPAIRIMEAMHVCDKINCPRPIAEQCEYNPFQRTKMELDYLPLFKEYGLGTTVWSPLAGGLLTGKYNDGIPPGSRFDDPSRARNYNKYFSPEKKAKSIASIEGLKKIADRCGLTVGQACLIWNISYSHISTCMIGASTPAQMEENLAAFTLRANLKKEDIQEITRIFDTAPETDMDYLTWQKLPNDRVD